MALNSDVNEIDLKHNANEFDELDFLLDESFEGKGALMKKNEAVAVDYQRYSVSRRDLIKSLSLRK